MSGVWQCRPPLGTPIDWSNPLTRGLATFIDAAGDRVNGAPLTLMGAAVKREDGAIYSPGGSSDGAYVPFAPGLLNVGLDATIILFARVTALVNTSALVSVPHNASWSSPWGALTLQRNGTNSALRFTVGDTSYGGVDSVSGFFYVEDDVSCYAVSRENSDVFFYKNGIGYAAGTTEGVGLSNRSPNFANRQRITIANRCSTAPGEAAGGIFLPALIYPNRALSIEELNAIRANPWQLYAPRRTVFFFSESSPEVAAGPATLSFLLPTPLVPVATRGTSRRWSVKRLIPVGRDLAVRHLAPGVVADYAAAHSVAGWVRRSFAAAHAVPSMVAGVFRARHAVLEVNPASRQWTSRHGIPADTAIFRPASWSAVFDDDGSSLDLSGANITGDRESYAWSVDLTLPDAEAWADCTPGRRLTLTVSGQPFALVLEGRTRDRAATSAEWTATARTVSCLLGEPYAAALSQSWPETTASRAASELAGLAGLSCSWEVCDWTLPAGRLTADAETPASVLSRLAQSCGGMLQPDPAGGVTVRYRYPVGVTEYADAAPRAVLTAADAVLTLSETFSAQPGYDAVTVVDNRAAADGCLTWELDDDRNAGRDTFPPGSPCYFRVYHEVDYAVRATSGTLERIAVDEMERLTETVGFDDEDTADLDKLVAAVDAVVWWGTDLGAVAPNGGANVLLSGGAGFSVAEITYRTRYDVWKLVPAALGEAFPVMLELAEVSA
ncbi:hypothetical protein DesfrDRAFT_0164 [Solidesulfovibrio fructosivorans JJ]]|uniref:Uncharacterized protein n=1 Tax=Solidesulfovibrio fructosivorans JJ] TaxID=596151 RepID=E1JRB5_SOLFR|nr:hypothetical protein [Solidesulfovibrio fructosivorans]EFL53116.1 hypothetical protein DesfrDRAFT_0164 [Solidesulfovibrio fructosivorans JJ]]